MEVRQQSRRPLMNSSRPMRNPLPLPVQQQPQPLPLPLPLPLPRPHYGMRTPLIGHKRDSSGFLHGSSPRPLDPPDLSNLPKLFVGSVPRNITEDQVQRLFSEYGNVLEVAILRDKRTGLQQGCCFIKYATVEEAERAIRALHNQKTLLGGSAPLQVKFANGDRDRQGLTEHKLFVGSLNKRASEKDIEEIFLPYGRVDDVYIMRDEFKQSRGCAFVKFPTKDMAVAAISALNGIYRMPGCDQPIIVRFADPKRQRSGDTSGIGGPGFGGLNFSPHFNQGGTGPRAASGPAIVAQSPPFGWHQAGAPADMGLLSQTGLRPLTPPISNPVRGVNMDGPQTGLRIRSIQSPPAASGQVSGSSVLPQISQQQGHSESLVQRSGQISGQASLHWQQRSQDTNHQQNQPSHVSSQPVQSMQGVQPFDTRLQQQITKVQSQTMQPLQGSIPMQCLETRLQQQNPFIQYSIARSALQSLEQSPGSQQHVQQQVLGAAQQPLHAQELQYVPLQQGSQANLQPILLQLAQPLQQSRQLLLPLQQASSQLNQQVSLQGASAHIQPANFDALQAPSQQHSSQQVTSMAAATVATIPASSAPTVLTCAWTEHISPEGHKYYYNSLTGESRWEKPEELTTFEQHQKQQQPPQQLQHQQAPQHQQQIQQQELQAQVQQLQQQQQAQAQQLQQQQAQAQQLQQAQVQQLHQQQQAQSLQLQQAQAQQLQQQGQNHQLLHHDSQQLPLLLLQQQAQPRQQSEQYQHQLQQFAGGRAHQPGQGSAQVHSTNGLLDPSLGVHWITGHQRLPANGTSDSSKISQQRSTMPQGLAIQNWLWKSKANGS